MARIVSTACLPDECRTDDIYGFGYPADARTPEEQAVADAWNREREARARERAPRRRKGITILVEPVDE